MVYNNGVFTEDDWTNIERLNRSHKKTDPHKVVINHLSKINLPEMQQSNGQALVPRNVVKMLGMGPTKLLYRITIRTIKNNKMINTFNPLLFALHVFRSAAIMTIYFY